jgi:hypothetical protein
MSFKPLASVLALAFPFAVLAQADDVAYCQALVAKYEAFYVKPYGHSPRLGPVDGNVAAEQCRAGNPAGIPVLERLLRNGKIDLPRRG